MSNREEPEVIEFTTHYTLNSDDPEKPKTFFPGEKLYVSAYFPEYNGGVIARISGKDYVSKGSANALVKEGYCKQCQK